MTKKKKETKKPTAEQREIANQLNQYLHVRFFDEKSISELDIESKHIKLSLIDALYDIILDLTRRQITAHAKLKGIKSPGSDYTDDEVVIHAYQSVMHQAIHSMRAGTEELERAVGIGNVEEKKDDFE